MPTLDIVGVAKMAFKLLLFALLLGLLGTFINFMIGKISPINLSGCMGYYADTFGLIVSLRIFLSILVYGFTAKFAFTFFKGYLD